MTAGLPPLVPEVDWLVAALQVRYGAEPAGLSLRSAGDLDWDVVFRTAERNAVTQLLAPVVATLPDGAVPQTARQRFDDELRRITVGNLDLSAELIRVLDRLDVAGIRGLPFKGPVLAQSAYGDLGLRRFLDLDVLVPPDAVPRAISVLRDEGYDPVISMTPRQWRAARRNEHAIALTHEERHTVELHWAIGDRASMLPRDSGPFFERATEVALGGHSVPSLAPTDQLTIVAIHGGRHLWERLAWICDVAEAADVAGTDVDRAFGIARGAGYGKALPIAFRMVERVLGVSPPWTPVVRSAAGDPAIDAICDSLLPLTLAAGGPKRASVRVFARERARIMDRPSRALRGTIRAVVTPTATDWRAVRLPDWLWALYYPLRVGRLLASYVVRDRRPGDTDLPSVR